MTTPVTQNELIEKVEKFSNFLFEGTVDPTFDTYEGQSVPIGSMYRNTITGQLFSYQNLEDFFYNFNNYQMVPLITNGILTFQTPNSVLNALLCNTTFKPVDTSWEIDLRYKHKTNTNAIGLLGNNATQRFGVSLFVTPAAKLALSLTSTGNSWDIADDVTGSTTLTDDSWYDIVIKFDYSAGKYTVTLNGASTPEIEVTSSTQIGFTGTNPLAIGNAKGYPLRTAEIDLKAMKFIINDEIVWSAYIKAWLPIIFATNAQVDDANIHLQTPPTDASGKYINGVRGDCSVVVGKGARSTAHYGTAIGCMSAASSSMDTAFGFYAKAGSGQSTAIGGAANTKASGAIQIGQGTNSTANTLSIGFYNNNSPVNYELLSANGTIPGPRMSLQAAGAPSTSTAGSVGQFYVDTTNQDAYICIDDTSSIYTWKKITP